MQFLYFNLANKTKCRGGEMKKDFPLAPFPLHTKSVLSAFEAFSIYYSANGLFSTFPF